MARLRYLTELGVQQLKYWFARDGVLMRWLRRKRSGVHTHTMRPAADGQVTYTMRPAADGRVRFVDGPFQGQSLEDLQRPPPSPDEFHQIIDARSGSLSAASEFRESHGPAYERILLSELYEWFVDFPSPRKEQVVSDALSIVSLLAHSIGSAVDAPEEAGASSNEWYQAIASGVARLDAEPNAMTRIDEEFGGIVKNNRSPSGFTLLVRGDSTPTTEETVQYIWKILMTALVVGPDLDDLSHDIDVADEALQALLSKQSSIEPEDIHPEADRRRLAFANSPSAGFALNQLIEISPLVASSWERQMAWLQDERSFEERHVPLYVHAVLEGLDETLYLPWSEFYASASTSKLYDALTWAVPVAISLSERGVSIGEVGTANWRREIADGVNRMRVDRESLFEVSRQTDKLVDIEMGRYHGDPDRETALVMAARPAFAFLAGGGEGLSFENGVYNPEWDERFEARLVEAESAARQALSF